jgi:hypothetical protein
MGTFTFNLPGATASGAAVNQNLYSKTPDADLTYTGTDTIVWDRVNAERLRRNLPSLTEIGSPRPPEDVDTKKSLPPTQNGSAQTFDIKGPPGLTLEQAKAIFDKQVSTGSLVGYKPGDVLSAATQAAAGLPGAQAALSQALSGVTGALGAGVPGAAQAIGSATQAIGGINKALGGNLGIAGPSVGNASELVATVQKAGSTAIASVETLNNAIRNTGVTAPIDVADFAKTATALTGIGSMTTSAVTAVVAQAKNLVGQAAATVSNSKGVGSVGLDVNQLEAAGLVKPGTGALLTATAGTLTSVLKSPSVWTGKDGITSLGSLTSSGVKQQEVLQGLMAKGVSELAAVGIPISSLSPQGLAGTALNAAKSVPSTEAFLKGLPIPGDATGKIKAEFDANVRDGAFAVSLAEAKIPDAFKEIDLPLPAANTINRDTLNAAMGRIVGNDKVPIPNYGQVDRSLYSKTTDADLIYAGNDTTVWDRVNGERLRRGLPGLAEIGYPRPPEETAAQAAARRESQQGQGG